MTIGAITERPFSGAIQSIPVTPRQEVPVQQQSEPIPQYSDDDAATVSISAEAAALAGGNEQPIFQAAASQESREAEEEGPSIGKLITGGDGGGGAVSAGGGEAATGISLNTGDTSQGFSNYDSNGRGSHSYSKPEQEKKRSGKNLDQYA